MPVQIQSRQEVDDLEVQLGQKRGRGARKANQVSRNEAVESNRHAAQRESEREPKRQVMQRAMGQFPESRDQEGSLQFARGHSNPGEKIEHWQQVVRNH